MDSLQGVEYIFERSILKQEAIIRIVVFAGVLGGMALWELLAPRRRLRVPRPARWTANLGMVALSTLAVRFVLPLGALAAAEVARERGFGALNLWPLPRWAAFVLGVAALDFVVYLQHVLFHAVPALWRLHMVHHTDLDFDTTTGVRFHPVEILISMAIKLAAVAALGPPPAAVLTFEALLNASSLFNHGNVALPRGLDRLLRLIVVTPDMHRVHHSIHERETNSNFGFNLPWWDRLFGTYRDQPEEGHEEMAIGLTPYRDPARLHLGQLLVLPLLGDTGRYPIGRRS